MFEIHPAAVDKAAALAQKEKVEPTASAMVLWENDVENGYILYRIEKDTVELLCARCADADLQEWLVRAALSAAVNRNAITAICGNAELFELLRGLGFAQEGDSLSMFIPDFFNRPCAGKCNSCG